MVLHRDLELARKSDPIPDPAGAPGMCLHGGEASRPFWVSVMNPIFENGELVLEFSFKNPCNQGSADFSREEARPLGYLGEFLFSVHVHMNQPQLSQQDWKMLNKWLVGGRLEDLQNLSPAFKQAVLDWARAMPSLIIGQNRVPQGQPGVTDDGWRRWTHDAISKLMAQYSRPLGTLPHQIMACLKQAHYSLGAGSFDGDGCTGFGLPGGLQGGPQQLQGAVAPATPLPLYDAQSPMANDQLLAHYHAEGKSPHFGQSRPYPGYPQPGLPHSSNFSDALGGVLGPRGSRKDETDPSKSLQASGGPRRSMRCRTSRDHDEPRPGHHSRSISELSTKTLAGLEPPEFPGLLMHEAMLRGQPADEARSSLDSDAGHQQMLLESRGREAIQRSSGGATIQGNASWMGCCLPPDLLDISPKAFPALKRPRMIWDGPPASHLELHKTLDHLENNQIGLGDGAHAAGDAFFATQLGLVDAVDVAGDAPTAAHPSSMLDAFSPEERQAQMRDRMSLLEPFVMDDYADLQSPRAGLMSPTSSLAPLAGLLSDSPAGPPPPTPLTRTSPAMPSSHCSNPLAAGGAPPQHTPHRQLQGGSGASIDNSPDVVVVEQPSCTLPDWAQPQGPYQSALGHSGPQISPALTPPHARGSQNPRQASRLKVNPLEGFDPYMGSMKQSGLASGPSSNRITSPTAPLRADAPSPPLRLSLQQPTHRPPRDEHPLPAFLMDMGMTQVGRNVRGGAPPSGSYLTRPPRTTATPPGCGSRVMSGCMTSAAMAAHGDAMAYPLTAGQRTRSISAPIVRQGPAILRSRDPHKAKGAAFPKGDGFPGVPRHLGPEAGKFPPSGAGAGVPASPQGAVFQEGLRRSEPMGGMWLPEATSGLPGPPPAPHYHAMNDLDLSAGEFPAREGSLSWGTVEAIAAGYVPGLDGTG